MKNCSHKSIAILLAILVVFSTLSFTIEKHFCGDVLVDVSVFSEAQKCRMEAMEMGLAAITKKNCCKDVVKLLKGQNELKVNTSDDFKFQQQFFLQAFVYSYVNLYVSLLKKIITNKDYSPPNLVRDIHVLDEVYLI